MNRISESEFEKLNVKVENLFAIARTMNELVDVAEIAPPELVGHEGLGIWLTVILVDPKIGPIVFSVPEHQEDHGLSVWGKVGCDIAELQCAVCKVFKSQEIEMIDANTGEIVVDRHQS